jgi:hypothetical protein
LGGGQEAGFLASAGAGGKIAARIFRQDEIRKRERDSWQPGIWALFLFRHLLAHSKVLYQLDNPHNNEYQRPIPSNEMKDVKLSQIMNQKQNPNSN